MKKRLLPLLIILALFTPARAAAEPPATGAASVILIHPETGRVLLEHNADTPRLIASTTKLMTALCAARDRDMEERITIDPAWAAVEGSSMYLRPGETYTLRELLTGLLLASGNDAALAIADSGEGGAAAFVERMNECAGELGMEHTHFANPHGLDDPAHYSTARDLARLMAAVLQVEALRDILCLRSSKVHDEYYVNHNKLLATCPGVDAGKTGYTKAAGRCLVSSCQRDSLRLICVTLSDRQDFEDHKKLYEWAFGAYRAYSPEGERGGSVPVISGEAQEGETVIGECPVLCLGKEERAAFRFHLRPFVFAPVNAGDRAGEAQLLVDGVPMLTVPLCFECGIRQKTL